MVEATRRSCHAAGAGLWPFLYLVGRRSAASCFPAAAYKPGCVPLVNGACLVVLDIQPNRVVGLGTSADSPDAGLDDMSFQLPAEAQGVAAGVLFYSFVCEIANILLVWLVWTHRERTSCSCSLVPPAPSRRRV